MVAAGVSDWETVITAMFACTAAVIATIFALYISQRRLIRETQLEIRSRLDQIAESLDVGAAIPPTGASDD